ncbi:hypothetical protein MATL_G00252700 [Megalops atlanticus]|uniref:C-type lectin domain-containing protein n=1 Tax=Megalops atlanticus TaxID=7932 RepID=A0A9D3P9L5_MEGAT|nr:hypothetical protein MATL_G00252700 [Megalops atlanticus]
MVSFPMSAFLCVAVLCGVTLVSGQSVPGGFCQCTCPDGWANFQDRCFQYIATKKTWTDAEAHCVSLGANLVSLHSKEEHQFLKKLIRSHDLNENPTWIGLSDCQKLKAWFWSDGSKADFFQWNSGEPNFVNNGECCVHTNWSKQKNWNDIPCRYSYPFVCSFRMDTRR